LEYGVAARGEHPKDAAVLSRIFGAMIAPETT
jgi:hypothetical protein